MKPPRRAAPSPSLALDELARTIAPLVAALLAERLTGTRDAWPRTSARRDAPQGVSPRRWSKIAAVIGRKVPGARFYSVERADWDGYLDGGQERARTEWCLTHPADVPPWIKDEPAWSPGVDLTANGLRATR